MSKCSSGGGNRYRNYTKQQHHHHQVRHIHQQQQRMSLFLPIMLCSRGSNTDIKLSHQHLQSSSSSSSISSSTSPTCRIGCIGGGGHHHSKRNNNKVDVGLITSATAAVVASSTAAIKSGNSKSSGSGSGNYTHLTDTVVKYRKIKQCFFSKSVTTSPTKTEPPVVAGRGGSRGQVGGGRRVSRNTTSSSGRSFEFINTCRIRSKCGVVSGSERCAIGVAIPDAKQIDIASLDPPLPVVRRTRIPQSGGEEDKVSLWKRRSGGSTLRCLQVQSSSTSVRGGVGGSGDSAVNTV